MLPMLLSRDDTARSGSPSGSVSSIRAVIVASLVVLSLFAGAVGPAAAQLDDGDGDGVGDDEIDLTDDGDDEPVGIEDVGGDADADADADAGAGGDAEADSDEAGEQDADRPPDDVSAGEYYDDEQLDEWQDEVDNELPIDVDVRELEATNAFELFVEVDEDGAAVGAEGTQQVGSDIGPSFDPGENAEDLAEWLDEWLTNGVIFFIDEVFNNLLGTPYHENDGWMGVLGMPVDEVGQELHAYMMNFIYQPVLMVMAIVFVAYAGLIMPASPIFGKKVTPVLLSMGAFFILVIFAWNFATLNQMMAHEATQWFLPDGEELLAIEENDGQADFSDDNHELRSGPLAALIGLKVFGWNVGVVLLMFHSARHVILILAPIVMPVLIAGMYFGPRASKALFSVLFWQYMGLTYGNIPTAIFFSASFNIDFNFGLEGDYGDLTNVAMTMFLFSLGLFFPVIIQTAAFGGALAAIIAKGSVLSAAKGYASKYAPSAGDAKRRIVQGGGYINPVTRYKRRSGSDAERDSRRRDVASRYGGGRSSAHAGSYYTPRSNTSSAGTVSTDGGYATMRPSRSTRSPSLTSRNSRDAGSVDHRRRMRYQQLRGQN